jgi:anthranilate phosphoribosyltransferase
MCLTQSIEKLMQKKNLDAVTCEQVLQEILTTPENNAKIAAFLVLLRAKPETSEELSAFIKALKQKMIAVPTQHKVLDIVGTGGDGAKTINISTGSAILAASCGIKIAKHGNRAVSSLAGSADVLEALGIKIDLSAEKIAQGIDAVGIGFCYAPHFHPALNILRTVRKSLAIPTTFNLLGPLLNPANPQHVLLGVFHPDLMQPIAQALQSSGIKRSMVVHGSNLDEMSCLGPTRVLEISQDGVHAMEIEPKKFGLSICNLEALKGGNAQTNAAILLRIFDNKYTKNHPGAAETLILNAGVALYLYGSHDSLSECIQHAKENLYTGQALRLLNNWRAFSNSR